MSLKNISISDKLVPSNYLKLAQQAQISKEIAFKELVEKRKLPVNGWSDEYIEDLVQQISALDSNNFVHKCGLGEREARIACNLVARRHYNFGHGIGRSGDLLEPQPKAAGSTLLANLTNALLLDLIRAIGIPSCSCCFLVPLGTGMALTMCMLSFKRIRPDAKYVLWSRIDQKSCFKCHIAADLTPIVIDGIVLNDVGLSTDLEKFRAKIVELGAKNILCIHSTTSCFAPRNSDMIIKLAKLALDSNIPHIINNAYGLQSTFITHQIEQAYKYGRVDVFVQSTDKNLMVPVGGAIIAGFNQHKVRNVAKIYPGRASISQSLDVFMTLLSLGRNGYLKLVNKRKENFTYLRRKLHEFATANNVQVIDTKQNFISLALSFGVLGTLSSDNLTQLGSMLYSRGVSGVRVVAIGCNKNIDMHKFQNWGAHHSDAKVSYLTVAAALGTSKPEIDVFFRKLEQCWLQLLRKVKPKTIE